MLIWNIILHSIMGIYSSTEWMASSDLRWDFTKDYTCILLWVWNWFSHEYMCAFFTSSSSFITIWRIVCVCLCQRKAYALCLNEMLHIFALQTSYHLVLSTIYCSLHFSFIAIRIRIYLSLFISNYFRMVFLVVFMNSLSLSRCFNSCLPILCALWFLAVCLFVCV